MVEHEIILAALADRAAAVAITTAVTLLVVLVQLDRVLRVVHHQRLTQMAAGIVVVAVAQAAPQFPLLRGQACLVQLAVLHLVLVDEAHSWYLAQQIPAMVEAVCATAAVV
jgi:hypothetical protein